MSETEIADDAETASRAERVIDRFVDAIDSLISSGSLPVDPGRRRVYAVAFGWWVYITRSSQAVLTLRRAGLEHEASPLVRSILQHGLMLQWLVDTGDSAVDAVEEYADENNRLLLKTMAETKWPSVPGLDATVPVKPAAFSPLMTKLKNFEELCIAYDARQLYVPFRLLSAYVHPTGTGARAYLDDTAGLSARAIGSGSHASLIQVAMCLIQSWKVIGQLVATPLTNVITQAENTLGSGIGLWTRHST